MTRTSALPPALRRRLDAAAHELIFGDSAFDFTEPPGEPALTAPDSVSWRVFKNPLSLFIGGVAAVILELAEPRVRTGVWEHTSFRTDPVRRLRRTGLAAMVTVYGARTRAEAMIAGVGRAHERINGVTPGGEVYRAGDPDLLTWVHATASFGFLEAYHRYVRPLTDTDRDRFYAEGVAAARLYGADAPPTSVAEQEALFAAMLPRLEPSPIVGEFLDIMRRAPVFPAPLRPMQRLLVRAAIDLTPPPVRQVLGLGGALAGWQDALVRQGGRMSDGLVLESAPPALACVRMGLPPDFLYR